MWLDLSIRIRLLHKTKIMLHKSDLIMSGVVRIIECIYKRSPQNSHLHLRLEILCQLRLFDAVLETDKLRLAVYQWFKSKDRGQLVPNLFCGLPNDADDACIDADHDGDGMRVSSHC